MFFCSIENGSNYFKVLLLTSDVVTYQSPLLLQKVIDSHEHSINVRDKNRIAIGDRVNFINTVTNKSFQVIIVKPSKKNAKNGFISAYSYLGGTLLGLKFNDKFNLFVFGELYEFKITQVAPEKTA